MAARTQPEAGGFDSQARKLTDDDSQPSAEILARIEAELAASKARILRILAGDEVSEPPTVATETFTAPGEPACARALSPETIQQRQRELHAIITSFEQRVGDDYDLAIVLQRFPDAAPLRLHSVTFFRSGAVSFIGLDTLGRSANLYDTLDDFALILKKVRRLNRSRRRRPVEFYTVTGNNA